MRGAPQLGFERHILRISALDEYFRDLGLGVPVKASTGRGYHLLMAYPEMKVQDHADIRSRLKELPGDYFTLFEPSNYLSGLIKDRTHVFPLQLILRFRQRGACFQFQRHVPVAGKSSPGISKPQA